MTSQPSALLSGPVHMTDNSKRSHETVLSSQVRTILFLILQVSFIICALFIWDRQPSCLCDLSLCVWRVSHKERESAPRISVTFLCVCAAGSVKIQ